jgi:hypothetical protein
MIDQRIEKGPRTTGAEGRQKNSDSQSRRSYESSQFSASSIALPNSGGAIRAPIQCESRTYELLKTRPSANVQGITNLFRFDELNGHISSADDQVATLPYREWDADEESLPGPRRRLIEHLRALYRKVETRTDTPTPEQLIRFQLGKQFGSASLESDEARQVISYEEYHPYGSASYQAWRSAADVSLKRHRYTNMERGEENGRNYHMTRYYALRLGMWASCDTWDKSRLTSMRRSPMQFQRMTQILVAKRNLCVVLIRPSLAPFEVVLKAFSGKAIYPAQKTRQYPHSQKLRFSLRSPTR